jgi:SAM-dependent MidA family methyltransferase
VNTVLERLEQELRNGVMPFARFMELALYSPEVGYYERQLAQIGSRGDFYTSVSTGPFFGELLAFQFGRWFGDQKDFGVLQIVEAGAHNGQLAADVLGGLRKHFPALLSRTEYHIVEPSPSRQQAQQAMLQDFPGIRWRESMRDVKQVRGVVFSNELLDAMPVHRFQWNKPANRWEEIGVAKSGTGFTWQPLSAPTTMPPALPQALLDVLPHGYALETSPVANAWWQSAAESLAAGKLLTIDYGGTFEEMLNPGRTKGSLRAYSRHHVSADVLAAPGEQDITADVDFTEISRIGEAAGLNTESFTTQSQFLTAIARDLWTRTGSWPQEQVRQFQTLTHPEHLGRPFRVLVQSR